MSTRVYKTICRADAGRNTGNQVAAPALRPASHHRIRSAAPGRRRIAQPARCPPARRPKRRARGSVPAWNSGIASGPFLVLRGSIFRYRAPSLSARPPGRQPAHARRRAFSTTRGQSGGNSPSRHRPKARKSAPAPVRARAGSFLRVCLDEIKHQKPCKILHTAHPVPAGVARRDAMPEHLHSYTAAPNRHKKMTPKSNAPVPFRPEAGLPATDPAASKPCWTA